MHHPTRGFSLVELVVGLAIGGIAMLILATQLSSASAMARRLDQRATLRDIAASIERRVDCGKTSDAMKAAAGGHPPAPGTAVRLIDKAGQPLYTKAGPAGAFQKSYAASGNWYARAVWNGSGITVEAAKKQSFADEFDLDPLDKSPLDFGHDGHRLYAAPPAGLPLCAEGQTKGFFIYTEVGLSRDVNPLVGLPANGGIGQSIYHPVRGSVACQRLCEQRGYVSGWAVEGGDGYVVDVNGSPVVVSYPPGESPIGCSCIR